MEELNTLISKAQNEIVNESDRNKALQKKQHTENKLNLKTTNGRRIQQ